MVVFKNCMLRIVELSAVHSMAVLSSGGVNIAYNKLFNKHGGSIEFTFLPDVQQTHICA